METKDFLSLGLGLWLNAFDSNSLSDAISSTKNQGSLWSKPTFLAFASGDDGLLFAGNLSEPVTCSWLCLQSLLGDQESRQRASH